MALFIYAITLFVSAFLLFLVQPILGQKILPKLGGTPSVWNTCVVFFQCALLVGYAYTHFTSKLPVRRQILIHCLLLFLPFLILLPYGPFPVEDFRPVTGADPTLPTLILLATIVGIPFFVVSTTAPLLQKWFGATGHPAARDPYFLYGASNLGSMLSLLMYPFVFERLLGLAGQSWFYTFGYVVLVGMVISCAVMAFNMAPVVQIPGKPGLDVEKTPSLAPEPPAEPMPSVAQSTAPAPSTAVASGPAPVVPPRPTAATGIKKGGKKQKGRDLAKIGSATGTATAPAVTATSTPNIIRSGVADPDIIDWGRRLRWIGLAAVPSSLMLGVTVYMSTDISAIPLFWVLPLALYLLSFILVFMRWPINWLEDAHDFVLYAEPVLLVLLALMIALSGVTGVVWMIFVMLLAFTVIALACHGELARDRPSAKHLTEFYLMMSVGGAVGGIFNAIIAPKIFPWGIVEFPLALMFAGLLRPTMRQMGWTEQLFEGKDAAAAAHRQTRSAKKVVQPYAAYSGVSLVFDLVLPLAVTLLVWVLIAAFTGGRGDYTEKLFYALILPVVITACFYARPLRFGLALGGILLVTGLQAQGSGVLLTTRSYFGLLRVREGVESFGNKGVRYVNLMHGTTHHGMLLQPSEKGVPEGLSRLATTYYHRQGPVGICMERFNWFPDNKNWLFSADARMPASLIGLGMPNFGISLPTTQLVGAWSEPPYAVIGLGTGTMASYARPYQSVHFYEIDEQIRQLSLPTEGGVAYFTYLKSALENRKANLNVLMGDARLRMAMPWIAPEMKDKKPGEEIPFDTRGGPEYFYHLMVVDAFSSDAIPRHLITKQAMEMYFRHLVQGHWVDIKNVPSEQRDPKFYTEGDRMWMPGGVLCVHTSNRHLRLVPVVADTAATVTWQDLYDLDDKGEPKIRTGLVAKRGHDSAPGHQYLKLAEDIGHFTSEWVIVARDTNDLKHLTVPANYKELIQRVVADKAELRGLAQDEYWRMVEPTNAHQWTDDHSNLMAVFRWPWEHGRE